MKNENRPYVIMQMGMSVDGRIAPRPDMTMFEPNPTDALLPDAASLWEKVTEIIENEWHPEGGMLGSLSIVRKDDPLKELPEFHGNAEELYEDYLPDNIVSKTQGWSILVDGQGRCRHGYNGTENPGGYAIYIVSSSVSPNYLAFLRFRTYFKRVLYDLYFVFVVVVFTSMEVNRCVIELD